MVRKGRPVAHLNADGLWHIWITVGERPNGRPRQRHIKRADKDECEAVADDVLDELKAGVVKKAGAKPTVESWMTTYFDTIAPQRCSPDTIYDYKSKMRNWVYPLYGGRRLDRFKPEHLDAIYLAMLKAEKAQSHQLKVHRILSRALDIAERRGHIGRNPCSLVDAPSVDPVRVKALDSDVALKIIQVVEGGDRRNPERWSIAFALGLRQGEALGLRWEDPADGTPLVDFDRKVLRIWYQLRRRIYLHGCGGTCGRSRAAECPQRSGGGLIYKKCKGKSARTIPIPPELIPTLKAARARQAAERLAIGEHWAAGPAVFTTVDGRLLDPREDYDEWTAILRTAEVRHVKPHIMRHTAATWLLRQGVDIHVVQKLLGHRDVSTTTIYTDDVDILMEEAVTRTLLKPKKQRKIKIKGVSKGVLHAVE